MILQMLHYTNVLVTQAKTPYKTESLNGCMPVSPNIFQVATYNFAYIYLYSTTQSNFRICLGINSWESLGEFIISYTYKYKHHLHINHSI